MKLSGKAKVAGVMGWPVGHSRSPMLHGHWLRQYGIDGAYVPMAVRPEKIGQALAALPALGFAGCNLTLPHKETSLPHLAEIDGIARRIGAVNTIVVRADGTLAGSNTDAFGFLENLKAGAPGWRPSTGPAVMIGAGGAARAVGVALIDAGVPEIRILNRTRARAETLAEQLGPRCRALDWNARDTSLDGAALLVNTSSLGMAGQPALDLALDALPKDAVVNDIVYVPLETPLLADARQRGHAAVDGLGMLLHQGRPGFHAWFGVDPQVTRALWDELAADIKK
ncbi:MAG: shikimate dehydrogenase [Alphaproteobacteria bacterium]